MVATGSAECAPGPSLLWRVPHDACASAAAPACFGDLNLDQVVATITAGRDEYDLRPFFHAPLPDVDAIEYRHEVFRDLEDQALRAPVDAFARGLRRMREQRLQAAALHDVRQRQRLFLDAAATYCAAVTEFARALGQSEPRSRGLGALAAYLERYVGSAEFTTVCDEAARVGRALAAVTYRLVLHQDRFSVQRATDDTDDGAAIERTFAKFGQRQTRLRTAKLPDDLAMNQIESAILERVARLHPDVFGALEAFALRHDGYLDATVAAFDREVQFYLAYLDYVGRFERNGLEFCYPLVSSGDKTVRVRACFDPALAHRLLAHQETVVCNDVQLDAPERIFVVTGANQGGKTTFARMFAQVHYLAALGCPVPGREARVFLFDKLLTHFEKEEDLGTLRGKLQDELVRMQALLDSATPRSIVIMNEAFTSTTARDALYLGSKVLQRLLALGALGVWVTFIDELASLDGAIASLVSGVDPDDPTVRTFELVRRPADGRAHAVAIAKAHRLTYDELRERLGS